eukprot:COSAG05_NODE_2512_length_2960_cov_10.036001_6_plen_133_part_00
MSKEEIPVLHTHLVEHVHAVVQPEDRWAVLAVAEGRLVGHRGLLLGDDLRVQAAAARTLRALRDDAAVVVDEEDIRVAAEVAAEQTRGTSVVVKRRTDIRVSAAGGAGREALPDVQVGVERSLGQKRKEPEP